MKLRWQSRNAFFHEKQPSTRKLLQAEIFVLSKLLHHSLNPKKCECVVEMSAGLD